MLKRFEPKTSGITTLVLLEGETITVESDALIKDRPENRRRMEPGLFIHYHTEVHPGRCLPVCFETPVPYVRAAGFVYVPSPGISG